MKIEAETIEEFFVNSGEKEEAIREVDKIVTEMAPELERKLFAIPSITLLGYGEIPWNTKTVKDSVWPLIGLAPQKNNISLYLCVYKKGKTVAEVYNKRLGKVSCGKSCVRFKKPGDLNLDELQKAINDAIEWSKVFQHPNNEK